MISRSLLLVLLGLVCIQSFTTAQNPNGPNMCCFKYQTHPITVKHIAASQVTPHGCVNPGVVFTLKNGDRVCADPRVEWVKKNMKSIEERLINSK